MNVYIDTRFFSNEQVASLEKRFASFNFIKDPQAALDAEIAIVTPPFVTQNNLNQFKKLKWIQLLTAGYDNADLKAAERHHVVVTHALDVFSIQIAEDVLSKILAFNRQLKGQIKHMSEGLWQHLPVTHELFGSTIGIIGTGSIGKEVAKRLRPFEVTLLGYRQKKLPVEYFDNILTGKEGLQHIIRNSDYLVIAIPLSKETFHLLNETNMKDLKNDAVIINVARGEIIDQDALVALLRKQNLRGVGLDVTTPEPLPSHHPLWSFDEVIITPHNAGFSPYMSSRLLKVVSDNIANYHKGMTLNYIVNN